MLLAKFLRALPLRLVAALGQFGGGIAYFIDARHRRVAMLNLTACLAEKTPAELRAICREHFRRLGENYAAAVKTGGMTDEALRAHLEIVGAEHLRAHRERGAIVAIGHFANFEIYARIGVALPGMRLGATYRALKQPRLDALVRQLRCQSGCKFFDRRRDWVELQRALGHGKLTLGLFCDQHRSAGPRVNFLGHACLANTAPALLAQRYNLPLHTAICFRTALARWRIEISPEIPTRNGPDRRNPAEIMGDVNAAFEAAVRRDPANWFWVHDRWRFAKQRRAAAKSAPA